MKKILILGATGFVGTNVALALQKQVSALILAGRDKSKLVVPLRGESFRQGDMKDSRYLATLFDDVDIVINAFAWTSLFGKEKESKKLFLQPSLALIDMAKKSGVKRFINLSTLSAADKSEAVDANSKGKIRSLWPHLNNVIRIEDKLREEANENFEVINLRCGLFVGEHYGLGLLPILLPRLKTHLVPLVAGGNTTMPLISGEDIAQAFVKASFAKSMPHYFESINILGPSLPKVKQVLEFIHTEYAYPFPHFSVPFFIAYPFARIMEILNPIMPFEPLVTRSIIHLLEDTHTNNDKSSLLLGYSPRIDWKEAVRKQMVEIERKQKKAMKMYKEIV